MHIKFPKWREKETNDEFTPEELLDLAEEDIEVEVLPSVFQPYQLTPVGTIYGSGELQPDSRIPGPGTYSRDLGGAAELVDRDRDQHIRKLREIYDYIPDDSEFDSDKYPTDYSSMPAIPKRTTRVVTHQDPDEVNADPSRINVSARVLGFGSPLANEIHWPLKGLDGKIDQLDVLGHEISHKALGHFTKVETSIGRSIESYNISKMPFIYREHPEVRDHKDFSKEVGQVLDEFEVRLYQEAEEYPIDNACRFDRYVVNTQQRVPKEWPTGLVKSIAIQALLNMADEGVIAEETARLYVQRIYKITPKRMSKHTKTSLGKEDELDLGDRLYDPDDVWMNEPESSPYYEDYLEALINKERAYKRKGTVQGRWTK